MPPTFAPLPVPPRTPTPPDESEAIEHYPEQGAGFLSPMKPGFDRDALSVNTDLYVQKPLRYVPLNGVNGGQPPTPRTPTSPFGFGTISSASSDLDTGSASIAENTKGPFNFQTVQYAVGKPPASKTTVGQRRGHKYKHSSVSHQIFLEPPPRAPLQLPASLPTPTTRECWRSMSREQTFRSVWCFCHLFVAAFVQWSAHGSLALTALSHLLVFDTLGAFLCAGVDVLGNFEVWKRSSIRHPFGLQRIEVLASFAMSVFLIFMGLDLISHSLTHFLESMGSHKPHKPHAHDRISAGSVDIAALAAIAATLVSALLLKNHARIGKALRFAYIESLPSVLSNPSHFLTLSCSTLLLLLPLISLHTFVWLDGLLSVLFAVAMLSLGGSMSLTLGRMLLMSYAGPGIDEVIQDIDNDPTVSGIDEAKFWQVHYGLCMANLKLRVRGSAEDLTRLRDKITSLVKNRLGGGYGTGGQRWEVSTQLTVEKNPWTTVSGIGR